VKILRDFFEVSYSFIYLFVLLWVCLWEKDILIMRGVCSFST